MESEPGLLQGIDWRWSDLIIAALLAFFFLLPLTFCALSFLLSNRWNQVILGIVLEASAVLPAVLLVARHRGVRHLEQFGLGRFAWKKAAWLGLAGGLTMFVVLQGYGYLIESLGIHLDQQDLLVQTGLVQRPVSQLLLFLLVAVLVAPVWEEIFFRGFVYTVARRRLGTAAGGLLSALLFALLHAGPFILQLPVFLMGVLLVVFYEKTRSLYAPIVAHGVANMLSTLLAYIGIVR